MDIRLFLSKLVMLVYRSREIGMNNYDGFIENALDMVVSDASEEKWLGVNKTKQLLEYISTLLKTKEALNKESFLSTLEVMLDNDPKLLKIIKGTLLRVLTDEEIKSFIISVVGEVNSHMRDQKAMELAARMSYDFKFNKTNIKNSADYIKEVISKLETLSVDTTKEVDPAIVRMVDFADMDSIESIFSDVAKMASDDGVYRTGWQDLNTMLQGGIRPGETCMIGALQHNFKSGFSRSLFMQMLTLNDPIMREEDGEKKPLALYISLEDPLENVFQFMYQYLKANEGIEVTLEEMAMMKHKDLAMYVHEKLTARGWNLQAYRIDPSDYTYSDLINLMLLLESKGYVIKNLLLDYLLMMSKAGCTEGPAGYSSRDLLRRTRNFTAARKIAYITPAQLSTAAKQLIRNGVSDANFLREIAEKGYYADSGQLDQELDIEIMVHIVKHGGKTYLSVCRGKHRLTTNIKDEEKHFFLPFPNENSPILEDVNKKRSSYRMLPSGGGGNFGGGSGFLDDVFA